MRLAKHMTNLDKSGQEALSTNLNNLANFQQNCQLHALCLNTKTKKTKNRKESNAIKLNTLMAPVTRVNGSTSCEMAMGLKSFRVASDTLETIKMTIFTAMAFLSTQMEASLRVNSKITEPMVGVASSIAMVTRL